MSQLEVISAFIDNEPFEPTHLADALAAPEGRTMLLDLIALRHLAEPNESPIIMSPRRRGTRRWPMLIAAAAVVTALVGGYQWGERASTVRPGSGAPPPVRVVSAGAEWVVPAGGSH